jgi:hypothetical protein
MSTEELKNDANKLPVGMSRTLIIGVGGTGKEVLTRIRKHIIQEFDSLDKVPVISFVQIDTDKAQPKLHLEKDQQEAGKLKGNEMVWASLSANDLGGDISKHRHLATWLSPGIEKYEITEGAKQIRQLGRLAFFTRYNDIHKAIQGGFERAMNPDSADRMIENKILVESEGINVYVIGSLSGGTGGGMLIDTAFLCRRIVKSIKGAKVYGYLVLPEVFSTGGATQVRANAFAALKEIDYFATGHSLAAQYTPEASTAYTLKDRPFTTTYLLNGTNENGVKLNATQLYDMVGLHIFTDFVPGGIGSLNRSNRDNLSARCDLPDKLGCNQAYMTNGVSRIFFPYERLIRACGLKLSLSLMDHWLKSFTTGQEYGRMKECVDDFCRQNPLWLAGDLHNGIVGKLATMPDNSLMREAIHVWLDGLQEAVRTQKVRNLRDYLSGEFGDFENEQFFDADPFEEKWRGFPRHIHRNLEHRFKEYQKSLDTEISKRVELDLTRNEAGLSYSIQFLDVLEERLKAYETRYAKAQEQELDALDGYFQRVTKALDHADSVSKDLIVKVAGGRDLALAQALAKLTDAAVTYFEAQLLTKVYRKAPEFLQRLQKHVQQWRAILSETQGILTNVQNDLLELNTKIRVGSEPGEIYDESDVEELFDEYLPDGEVRRNRLMDMHLQITRHFGCEGFFQLPQRARADMDFKQRMEEAMVAFAEQYFQDIAKISLAERFYRKYPNLPTQEMVLREAFKRAAPYMDLTAVPGYAHEVEENKSIAIGIAGGNQKSPDQYFAQLLKQIKLVDAKITDKVIMDMSEREKHQIIFIRERAAFPLRAISQIQEYSLTYQDYMNTKQGAGMIAKDQAPPIHMIKDDNLFNVIPGVLPADEERTAAAIRAFVIGTCWNIFDVEGDTVIYRVPRPGLGIDDRKVIGNINDPDKAIMRLLSLAGEGQGPKVMEQVVEKIRRKVEEARLDPQLSAKLHHKLTEEFVKRERLALEAYRRDHPEMDEVNEGYRHTLEYRFCAVIERFLEETGLKPPSTPYATPEPVKPEQPTLVTVGTAQGAAGNLATRIEQAPASAPVGGESRACPSCQQPNPALAKFCAFCSSEMASVTVSRPVPGPTACGSCRTALIAGARGCHMCGWKVPPAQVSCGGCETVVPAEAKFCPNCVTAIVLA